MAGVCSTVARCRGRTDLLMLAHMFVFIVASRLSLITYRWLVEWRSGWIGLGQGNLTVRTERECPLKRPERQRRLNGHSEGTVSCVVAWVRL